MARVMQSSMHLPIFWRQTLLFGRILPPGQKGRFWCAQSRETASIKLFAWSRERAVRNVNARLGFAILPSEVRFKLKRRGRCETQKVEVMGTNKLAGKTALITGGSKFEGRLKH
jgi:hypothetical protein